MPGSHSFALHLAWHRQQTLLQQHSLVIAHNLLLLVLLEWKSAYQESLEQHGSVRVAVTRTIFVGPPEAGKSTLKHLLVHNKPKEIKKSTAVMDTPEVVTFSCEYPAEVEATETEDGQHENSGQLGGTPLPEEFNTFSCEQYVVGESTSAWQLVESDVMGKALRVCIANKSYEVNKHYPAEVVTPSRENPAEVEATDTEDGQSEVSGQLGDTPHRLTTKLDQSGMDQLDEQRAKLLEAMGGEGEHFQLKNASFMHLLDTGGQPSFQDVLPLLLDVPCTYIQVFNAALSLDEPVPITYRCDEDTKVCLESEELGREMMMRSFSSMQTMAQKCSKKLVSFQQKGSLAQVGQGPQLRIFVVGTYKDTLANEGRLEKATEDIKRFMNGLKKKPYYRSIQFNKIAKQPFFLFNAKTNEDEREVNYLREYLSCKGSPLQLDVPVMWFFCQEITRRASKKFFRFQDLEAFCRKHGFIDGENAPNQFRALLQLFSLLGFYSFFNLKGEDGQTVPDKDNFVCTDSGAFLREVSKVLAVQFTEQTGHGLDTFKETEFFVFSPELLQDLEICQEMDPKWFLDSLKHLGIAACLPDRDPPEYFIPAALLLKSAIPDPPASVEPLCLTYKIENVTHPVSDMPRGVFCRLVVELINNKWFPLGIKEHSRSLLKLRDPQKRFDIFLQECPGYIRLIPQALVELPSPSELHAAFTPLISTVKKCLSVSTEHVLGSQFSSNAKLTMGFRCPCKEDPVPHLAIPPEHGQFLECLPYSTIESYSKRQRIWFSSVEGVEVSISWRC